MHEYLQPIIYLVGFVLSLIVGRFTYPSNKNEYIIACAFWPLWCTLISIIMVIFLVSLPFWLLGRLILGK